MSLVYQLYQVLEKAGKEIKQKTHFHRISHKSFTTQVIDH